MYPVFLQIVELYLLSDIKIVSINIDVDKSDAVKRILETLPTCK